MAKTGILPEDVECILVQIRAGDPCLDDLTRMCLPLILWARAKWFPDIPVKRVVAEIARDAVVDAIARNGRDGVTFLRGLPNRFKDLCRKERRAVTITLIDDLAHSLGLSDATELFEPSSSTAHDPAYLIQRREEYSSIREKIRQEPRLCQIIMFRSARGSSYSEIAARCGDTCDRCRATRHHNVLRIRRGLNPSCHGPSNPVTGE